MPQTLKDRPVTLTIVIILGLLALSVVLGGIILTMNDKSIPDALIAIGAGAATNVVAVMYDPTK